MAGLRAFAEVSALDFVTAALFVVSLRVSLVSDSTLFVVEALVLRADAVVLLELCVAFAVFVAVDFFSVDFELLERTILIISLVGQQADLWL